jgi:hypothetical protein
MTRKFRLLLVATGLFLMACATLPTGPNVMVLPGNGKDLEQFQGDDAVCRQWAGRQTGMTPAQASNRGTATGAAIGTVLGAAGGAAVGAAAGSPATGAAAGSGLGLLGGTALGASNAEGERLSLQDRYDIAYMQCMYVKGNQIPIPRGSVPTQMSTGPAGATSSAPTGVPPPPPGSPPPAPPGPSR